MWGSLFTSGGGERPSVQMAWWREWVSNKPTEGGEQGLPLSGTPPHPTHTHTPTFPQSIAQIQSQGEGTMGPGASQIATRQEKKRKKKHTHTKHCSSSFVLLGRERKLPKNPGWETQGIWFELAGSGVPLPQRPRHRRARTPGAPASSRGSAEPRSPGSRPGLRARPRALTGGARLARALGELWVQPGVPGWGRSRTGAESGSAARGPTAPSGRFNHPPTAPRAPSARSASPGAHRP